MSMWSSASGEWAMTSMEAGRSQCCPMSTYDTDSTGNLVPVCDCEDECTCMCLDCICGDWGEEL